MEGSLFCFEYFNINKHSNDEFSLVSAQHKTHAQMPSHCTSFPGAELVNEWAFQICGVILHETTFSHNHEGMCFQEDKSELYEQ
uniref:Uncharacterized protein n=1 Tax=Anguilla anguilla TaxID=7936 RepID=A0A0E9S650_ANGAN